MQTVRSSSLRVKINFLLTSFILLAMVVGVALPLQKVTAAACSTSSVYVVDNLLELGGVFTFYEDTGTGLRGFYTGYTITNGAATTSGDIWVKLDTFAGGGVRINLAPGEDGIIHVGPLAAGESKRVYFYLYDAAGTGDNAALNETLFVNLYYGNPTSMPEICDYQDTINVVEDDIAAVANKVHVSVVGPNAPELGGIMTMTVVGETGTVGADQIFAMTPASTSAWLPDVYHMTDVSMEYWYSSVCPDTIGGVPIGAPTNTYNHVLTFYTPGTQNSCYRVTYTFTDVGIASTVVTPAPVNHISSGTQVKHTGRYETTPIPIQPAVNHATITKSVSPINLPTGGTVDYTVTIHNSGTVSFTLDYLVDTLPTGTSYQAGTSYFNGTLITDPIAVGQVLTWYHAFVVPAGGNYQLTYKVTIPNVAGSYINSVVGFVGSTTFLQIDTTLPTNDNSPATSTVTVGSPDYTILKSITSSGPYDSAGDTINYSVLVTNTGTLAISGVSVSDPLLANLDCDPVTVGYQTTGLSIAVGSFITCTGSYAITQTDLDTRGGGDGDIDNTASVTSTQIPTPRTSSQAALLVYDPAIQIVKTSTTTAITTVFQLVPYSLTVTNTGNVTLTIVTVTDPDCSSTPTLQSGDTNSDNKLQLTETWVYTCSHTVSQTEVDAGGNLSNTATADSSESLQDTGTLDIPVNQTATLVLTKTGTLDMTVVDPDAVANVGDTITYSFSVENTGNVTLNNITVTDPLLPGLSCSITSLAPGATSSCTASSNVYTLDQDDIDNGSVANTATADSDESAPDDDDESVSITQVASLVLTKTGTLDMTVVDPDAVANVGDTITYSFSVENTGNVTLNNITVTDPLLPGLSCSITSLAPGATSSCTASGNVYTLDQDDIDNGSVANTATADSDESDPDDDDESVSIAGSPVIGIAKTLVGVIEVSTGTYDVTYDFVIRNYGNLALHDVQVQEDLTATFTLPTTFSVQSITSPDSSLTTNSFFDGDISVDMLVGSDILDVGDDGTIRLVVRVIPASNGPFWNQVTAIGLSPADEQVMDDSQDGVNPDSDDDGDPTNNDDPTLVEFTGPLFDPPFGVKVFNDDGYPLLEWTMVWVNNSNLVPVYASVSDPIPAGTTYVASGATSGYPVPAIAPLGSTNTGVTCTDSSASTTTDLCYYEGPSVEFPLGRIYWEGVIGPDYGVTDPASAENEITITFRVNVGSLTSAYNLATISSDLDGDGDASDPGEQDVALADASWTRESESSTPTALPATGFTPGRITILPPQAEEQEYSTTGGLWLEIPAISVRSSIVGVPVTDGAWDVSWLGTSAGWLNGTAYPSTTGNSVITGHVYMPNGKPGPFVNLNQLHWGDLVSLHIDGMEYIYQVRTVSQVTPGDLSALRHEELSWITLITCRGYDPVDGMYDYRTVVRAVLINVRSDASLPSGLRR